MISILIKSSKEFDLSEKQISQWAKKALKSFGQDNCELSIFFVNPKKILTFNQEYRNLNEATSVLTFFQGQATPEKVLILGDIVICPAQAEEKNLSIRFLIKHGIKNLLSEISSAESLRAGSGGGSRKPPKNLKV